MFNLLWIAASAALVQQTLDITRGLAAPDCFQTERLLVNGQFMGPTIQVQAGDTLALTIKNNINASMSIHMHGLHQRYSKESDGASYVTNSPLNPFETRTTQSVIENYEAGTFFYHAHIELYDMHVYGALVVKNPAGQDEQTLGYDEERTLVLSDYYRADPDILHTGLMADPFKFVGVPDSFVTNGKTIGSNCTAPSEYDVTTVEPGKKYRFRIIGAGTLFYVNFRIPGHKMTLVEVEGQLIKPIDIDSLELFTGQRYSVIVTADQTPGDYWMQQQGMWRAGAPQNGYSILRYANTMTKSKPAALSLIQETAGWITSQFAPLKSTPYPEQPNMILMLEGTQQKIPGTGKIKWFLNNVTYELPSDLTILQHAKENSLSKLPVESKPFEFSQGDIVDIIFQNTVALSGVCEPHPWHLHGHSYWVLSQGGGAYDPRVPDYPFPIKRDTVTLYAFSHGHHEPKGNPGDKCGWVKVRFVADNPGAWALHCHVIAHFAMGMGTTIVEARNSLV